MNTCNYDLPEGMAYAIKDWEQTFEVAQSRRVKDGNPLKWIAMPTKHDGKGLRRILRGHSESDRSVLGEYSETHQQILVCGPALYGVWCLLAELAGKMPIRGVFMDEEGSLTAEDLADSIGIDPAYVECVISFCLGDRMKWLELIPTKECESTLTALRAQSDCKPRADDEPAPTGQDSTVHDMTVHDSTRQNPPTPKGVCDGLSILADGEELQPRKRAKWSKAELEKEKYAAYPGFEAWWKAYPNATGKRLAFEAWVKRGLEFEDQDALLRVLRLHCSLPDWKKDGGQFVPHGATYLNQRRDEDDPEPLAKLAAQQQAAQAEREQEAARSAGRQVMRDEPVRRFRHG